MSIQTPRDIVPRLAKLAGSAFTALSWNVNGLRSITGGKILDKLVDGHAPDLLVLQETKLQESNVAAHKNLISGYTSHWTCSGDKKVCTCCDRLASH